MQPQLTLSSTLWPESSLLRNATLAIAGSAILALSAQISVPLGPVPFTLQTLAVAMIGMAYGSRLAVTTVLLYLAQGAAGLPVFANGTFGLPVLMGPTAGYLFGFIAAALATGYLAERGWDRSVLTTVLAMLIGNALIYIPGVSFLSTFVGSFDKAIAVGFAPFMIGDAIKIAIAAGLMPTAWAAMKHFGFLGEK